MRSQTCLAEGRKDSEQLNIYGQLCSGKDTPYLLYGNSRKQTGI